MERRKQSDRTLSWCGIAFLPLMTLGCSAEAPESLEGAARGAQQPLTSTSISSQISGGNDDAEERSSGTYLNSSDLELALDGSNEQLIGLRFTQGLNIPSNATITAAHIEFTVKNPSSSYTALTFFGQKEGDTGPFAMTQGNLFWRTELSSSKTQEVHWAYNGGSNDPSTGGAGSKFDSPDLSGIIQEIVDASTFWQPGQTPLLLYMVGNGSGFRRVWSYEGSAANAPVLHIEYTTPECTNGEVRQIPCGPSGSGWMEQTCTSDEWVNGACVIEPPSSTTVTSSPAQSTDDAEVNTSGNMYLNSSDLELVDDPSYAGNDQQVGIRFPALDVPQGATITSAHINFTPKSNDSGAANLLIQGHDVDDSVTFNTAMEMAIRFVFNSTSNTVNWNNIPAWSVSAGNPVETTPDLSAIVQEIVNRPAWQRNNALSILISGDGRRTAASYDHNSLAPPQLVVTYETGTSQPHTCVAPSIANIPSTLAGTGCFDSQNPQVPTAGVLPYSVNHTFWSNGALKERWFAVPPGTTIDASVSNDWELPVGAVTIKNFFNPATNALFETRFYVRHAQDGYHGYTYRWTNSTTAVLVDGTTGLNEDDDPGLGPDGWRYPDDTECRKCHNDSVNGIIGFSQRQIDGFFDDPLENATVDQIPLMMQRSVLSNVNPTPAEAQVYDREPAASAVVDSQGNFESGSTQAQRYWAGRSYLDVNCSYCHNGEGYDPSLKPSMPVDFFEGSWDGRIETDLASSGLCSRSFIPAWVNGQIMPEVGISQADAVGVTLLTAWFSEFCQ